MDSVEVVPHECESALIPAQNNEGEVKRGTEMMAALFSTNLRRFFGRHGRILTLLGALIVFLTFVVKDGLREHLKDAASSISAANDVFAIREDNMGTRLELEELKKDLDGNATGQSWSDIRIVQAKCRRMYYALGAVAYLVKAADDKEDTPTIRSLDQELTKIRFDSLALNMSASTVGTLGQSASALELRMAKFEDDVVERARLKLQQRQALYDSWTWISYVLYTIGWGLGLVGKLCGVPGAAGEA
jgi:hypothetical protein